MRLPPTTNRRAALGMFASTSAATAAAAAPGRTAWATAPANAGVMTVGSFKDTVALAPPIGIDLIQTLGYAEVGRGAASYRIARSEAPAPETPSSTNTAAGHPGRSRMRPARRCRCSARSGTVSPTMAPALIAGMAHRAGGTLHGADAEGGVSVLDRASAELPERTRLQGGNRATTKIECGILGRAVADARRRRFARQPVAGGRRQALQGGGGSRSPAPTAIRASPTARSSTSMAHASTSRP